MNDDDLFSPQHGCAATSEDTLLDGRVRLMQPQRGYRAAIDPVLLAAAAMVWGGERVLDVGLGTGAAALCLAYRVPEAYIVGIEIQPELAELARRNSDQNGMAHRMTVIEGDVRTPSETLLPGSFDHVITNPPYGTTGTEPSDPSRAIAHRETMPLFVWLGFAVRMLRVKGRLTLIHRADRLDEILACLYREHCGGVDVIPLWPRVDTMAARVVVRARRGSKTPLRLLPGLVLHDEAGCYTPAAEAILRRGDSLYQ